jgi:ribosomal-protein-alanine N-acetyltransferase
MTRAHQSSMKITLRDYTPADFETLYEIDQQTFEPGIAYSRPQLRDYLQLEGGECVLAESDGKIAGFLVAAHDGGIGYVVTIDVLSAYRKQSVGTALLTETERRLAASGVRRIELETATDNASAIAFWQKHGYRNRGVIKHYYSNGRDAFSMSKPIP